MIPNEAIEAAIAAFNEQTGNLWDAEHVRPWMMSVLQSAAPYMLREAKAEAWEEGFAADDYEVSAHLDYNPYRRTSDPASPRPKPSGN